MEYLALLPMVLGFIIFFYGLGYTAYRESAYDETHFGESKFDIVALCLVLYPLTVVVSVLASPILIGNLIGRIKKNK